MKILFTKSCLPLSLLIRWGLNEPVSHLVVLFDDDRFVMHSNLVGAHLQWFSAFKKSADIVYQVELPKLSLEQEDAVYTSLAAKDGKMYDYKAFLYFAWRALLYKLFKKPIPSTNVWGDPNDFLCTGMIKGFPESISPRMAELAKRDTEMLSPYQIYLFLISQ